MFVVTTQNDLDFPMFFVGLAKTHTWWFWVEFRHPSPQENLFCAFALARVAAAMRVDHMERALGLFDLAKKKIQDGELGGGLRWRYKMIIQWFR